MVTLRRFWSKVQKSDDCWTWTGAKTRGGYGNFWYRGRNHSPHRWLWIQKWGPVPAGLEIDHACHDPRLCPGGPTCPHRLCVNPSHLRAQTPAENSAPGRRAGYALTETHCKHEHLRDASNTNARGECRKCASLASLASYHRKRTNQ